MQWWHHFGFRKYLMRVKQLFFVGVCSMLSNKQIPWQTTCFIVFSFGDTQWDIDFVPLNVTIYNVSLCYRSACQAVSIDDVIKWKHFPRYWPFVRGIHRSPVNSPHKGQWRGALLFSLVCACINSWVNNLEAGDLRHHRAHYDVIVMHWDKLGLLLRTSTSTKQFIRDIIRNFLWDANTYPYAIYVGVLHNLLLK